jgi:hypothetical protein
VRFGSSVDQRSEGVLSRAYQSAVNSLAIRRGERCKKTSAGSGRQQHDSRTVVGKNLLRGDPSFFHERVMREWLDSRPTTMPSRVAGVTVKFVERFGDGSPEVAEVPPMAGT